MEPEGDNLLQNLRVMHGAGSNTGDGIKNSVNFEPDTTTIVQNPIFLGATEENKSVTEGLTNLAEASPFFPYNEDKLNANLQPQIGETEASLAEVTTSQGQGLICMATKPPLPPEKTAVKPRRKVRRKRKPSPFAAEETLEEMDRKFRRFRSQKYGKNCGPGCECFDCRLLYLTSHSEDSDSENESGEQDRVTLTYCLSRQAPRPRKKVGNLALRSKSGRIKRTRHPFTCYGDQLRPALPPGVIQVIPPSPVPKGRMPLFVREFEAILTETRQFSISDAIIDELLKGIFWAWGLLTRPCIWIHRARRNRRKVVPELPLFGKTIEYNDNDGETDALVSVTVIKQD